MSCYKNTASFTESAEISLIPNLEQLQFLFILDGYYYLHFAELLLVLHFQIIDLFLKGNNY